MKEREKTRLDRLAEAYGFNKREQERIGSHLCEILDQDDVPDDDKQVIVSRIASGEPPGTILWETIKANPYPGE